MLNNSSNYSLITDSCYHKTNAVCNLLPLVLFFSLCLCACGKRDIPHHNQSTTAVSGTQDPIAHIERKYMHLRQQQKHPTPPLNVAACALRVSTNKGECKGTKAQRKCATAARLPWRVWCRVSVGNWVQRTGPCMVKKKLADPHSSGVTGDYFGAFWSLPRKHNNFGVSSFIYLLCFSI